MTDEADGEVPFPDARVAVVHEWVASRAGSEKVFESIAQLLPHADLYALTAAPDVELHVGNRTVHTTWLDRFDLTRRRRDLTLPVMPLAWQGLRGTYDVVISSSHAFARVFPPARSARHFSYVHTPARYLWTPQIDGRHPPRGTGPLVRLLKAIDRGTVHTTQHLAANSTETAGRVRQFYGRDAAVIPPPVDLDRLSLPAPGTSRSGLLSFGRWIPYKRVDLAIRAAHLANEPLTIAGSGPEEDALRRLVHAVGANVRFERAPSDDRVATLLHTHRALLFPGREDFGIVPVEAAASGLPTIAYGAGGALDTVIGGVNGWLVHEQSPEAFADTIVASRADDLDRGTMRRHARRFDAAAFRRAIRNWLAHPAT